MERERTNDELYELLVEVRDLAKSTNGRVNKHDIRISIHDFVLGVLGAIGLTTLGAWLTGKL